MCALHLQHEQSRKGKLVNDKLTSFVKSCPNRRKKIVKIVTANDDIIFIPLLDAVCIEIEAGRKLYAGWIFDIYT